MICIGATRHNDDNTTTDMTEEFVKGGYVHLTYDQDVGHFLDLQLKNLPLGTLVAIKSYSVKYGLFIKAIGIISDLAIEYPDSRKRKVKWLWWGNHKFGVIPDKMVNMRSGALYHELNTEIVQMTMELIPHII